MAVDTLSGSVVTFSDFEHRFSFFIESETDLIQEHHKSGRLYEREELEIIQKHSKDAGAFLDIGANVGNHAIFFAKVLKAPKVFVFEANPFTCRLLDINIALNGLTNTINSAYTGIGLGSSFDTLNVIYPQVNNLGSARLASSGESQDISYPTSKVPVLPLDSLNIATTERIGFVKIDVEGMELDVLRGAERFIASYRPTMFVEVHNEDAFAFTNWAASNEYVIFERFRRYPQCENFLIISAS